MSDASTAAAQQRGRFIVFEGGEGAGKSTQATLLAASIDAVLTREPGGTALGQQLRTLLLDTPGDETIAIKAEALLMAADRAQHVATHVRPALESGKHVVSDRYLGSSVAYQGYGRGLDPTELADISLWATDGLYPDIVFLIDVPADLAWERIGGARDRIEAAGSAFHDAVRQGFLKQAEDRNDTWVVIDGTQPADVIADRVLQIVHERFSLGGEHGGRSE